MSPNSLLLASNMDDGLAADPGQQSNYLSALLTVNYTTIPPDDEYVLLSNPANKIHRIVETVGILAALAVGAIIIIGVAFIMSKVRKRNAAGGVGGEQLLSCKVVMPSNPPLVSMATTQQNASEASLPTYDVKHVYSITGVIASASPPPTRRSLKSTLLPNFLKKKPTELVSVHDALKRDLSRIYVY